MELNIASKCRICLGDFEEMNYLFDDLQQGFTLHDIFVDDSDGFSSFICERCTTILIDFHNLKIQYEENQKQIAELLGDSQASESQAEDEDEEHDYITIELNSSDSDDSDNANCNIYEEFSAYNCPECKLSLLDKEKIANHMKSQHNLDDSSVVVSFLKVLKKPGSEAKKHARIPKNNVCDICGMTFTRKSYLKDHQEVHFSEKRHVCTFCNKAFKRRTVLVKHKRIHTNPRECICEICGKAFNDKGTLKKHIALIHVRERNYMCGICGDKFSLKSTLEKHVKRHENKEREFFCTKCPLGYKDKSSLDRHIVLKHSGKDMKSTCDHCGKQYSTTGNLLKHQRSCHREFFHEKKLRNFILPH